MTTFRSRAQLQLVPPRSVSYNVQPRLGGIVPHWGGDAPRIRNHMDCEAVWRGWQNFHMRSKAAGGRGWVDIAYNFAFCDHDYVLAGRGYGVRSGANGTNDGNYRYMAACWIGGLGRSPSAGAYRALDWIVVNVRSLGGGNEVVPHRVFTGSQCPGPDLIAYANRLHNKSVTLTPTQPDPSLEEEIMKVGDRGFDVAVVQMALNDWRRYYMGRGDDGKYIAVDHNYGTETAARVNSVLGTWEYPKDQQDGIMNFVRFNRMVRQTETART